MASHSVAPPTAEINTISGAAPPMILVDDLIRWRALDEDQVPLLYFAKGERSATDFEQFNGKDLDRFVDHAAKFYINKGLKPVRRIP